MAIDPCARLHECVGRAKYPFHVAPRIINPPALCITIMLIEGILVLNCTLECLDLSDCCNTTQSNLVVGFIVGAAITEPC